MIIDFHTHAFPDKVAAKAIPRLVGIGGIPCYGDGTVSGLLSHMDSMHIDRAVVLNIATNPKQQTSVNDFAIELNNAEERLYALGSIHPDSDCIAKEARRLADAGIVGIKLHPDYMETSIEDEKFDPIFRACLENNLFVVTHSGWDFYSPDFVHCTPKGLSEVLDRYPGLRVVAAHMGANKMWDDVERYLVGRENLWIETSLAPMFALGSEQARRILHGHSPDRLMFGSDFPWYPMDREREYVESLALSDALMQKICSENALALLENTK